MFFHNSILMLQQSSLEQSNKKQKNVLKTMFRKTKSRYEELEVFFQIISLIRYLRRSLSLKER